MPFVAINGFECVVHSAFVLLPTANGAALVIERGNTDYPQMVHTPREAYMTIGARAMGAEFLNQPGDVPSTALTFKRVVDGDDCAVYSFVELNSGIWMLVISQTDNAGKFETLYAETPKSTSRSSFFWALHKLISLISGAEIVSTVERNESTRVVESEATKKTGTKKSER